MTKEENEKRLSYLKGIVSRLPDKPGSYQFYDDNKTIIYVGKAKNLKARVSTYFHTEVDRFKTKVLVSKIFDISYTVVNSEEDALLLENSLIKKYNPRYNVLLQEIQPAIQRPAERRQDLPFHLCHQRILPTHLQHTNHQQEMGHLLRSLFSRDDDEDGSRTHQATLPSSHLSSTHHKGRR